MKDGCRQREVRGKEETERFREMVAQVKMRLDY